MSYAYLDVISQIIGWVYFFAWSFSFYPQVLLNYRKKSVAGFSLEFALLNVSGFFFYSLYSMGGFIYPHLGTGEIKPNDLFFAFHAFSLASIQLSQAYIYERGQQKTFALWAVVLLIVEWITLIVVFLLEGVINIGVMPQAFNTFRVAGYNKAIITFLKYVPQVWLNCKRKSTQGWSILNIFLDFTGGSLSILQQVLDMVYNGLTEGNWSFFGSGDGFNIVKFMLGVMSIFFDIIFMIQHFILFRGNHNQEQGDTSDPLITRANKFTPLAEDEEDYEDRVLRDSPKDGKKGINNTSGSYKG
ncbi:unnamed protein product [Moneuplotes crassus]|uniref:Cystinosin n=1 Tax=Euplotes crassus TaxID=5936 RepID=A0AAD2D1I2_EUPCR|nr:unnamed protein product [Moneuplotes crassus]